MYNVQCAINNVQSSSAMTSDERWLHDWSPMPSTEFHPYLCWNTQMSPTIRTYFQNGSKFSSHFKKVQYLQVSPLSLALLLKHSNVSNISTRIRSPKWKQNLKSSLKGSLHWVSPLSLTPLLKHSIVTHHSPISSFWWDLQNGSHLKEAQSLYLQLLFPFCLLKHSALKCHQTFTNFTVTLFWPLPNLSSAVETLINHCNLHHQ